MNLEMVKLKPIAVLLLLLFVGVGTAGAQSVKGVPHWLAEARAADISNVNYILSFRIPELRELPVKGTATVLFDLEQRTDVIFDFQGQLTQNCVVNGREHDLDYKDEHIVIPAKYLRKGNNVVEFTFNSLDQALNRNDDYMYTLFVPDHARSVFPCFDQPDLKATFSVALDLPDGWKSMVSCGTKPIPTYLFSFVAGRFNERMVEVEGFPIRALYRETDPLKVKQLDRVLSMAATAVSWMEQYTGIPYPFDSYGLVVLPGYQFGGMEHPGAIQLSDQRVFLGKSPTQDDLLSRFELIAHETAHMWFGDLVTMQWFDDVWTKEVFANYMASKMSREEFPDVNHDLNFLKMYQQPAVSTDRTEGTHPIRQQLDNLNQASLLYGNIIYDKAPVVMRKIEELMGAEDFQQGVRNYLSRHLYGNATWDDLISCLHAQKPAARLKKFSEVWTGERGMPVIHTEYRDGRIIVTQSDPLGRNLIWPQKFQMMLGNDMGTSKVYDVPMNRRQVEIPVPGKPHFIIPNYNGQGYGRFTLDDEYLRLLTKRLICTNDELPRYAITITLFDNYLMHRLKPSYFGELYRMMEKETSPLILSTVSRQMAKIAFYADGKARRTLELCMVDLSKVNHTPACRQNIMRILGTNATSTEVNNHIYKLWQQGRDPLYSEADYMAWAYHLAIARPQEWKQILATQRRRLKSEDSRREFDFVSQACTPDRYQQQMFFQSLLQPANRPSEPWTQRALSLLNTNLREPHNNIYITPALNVLQNIQDTGGIFFPANWLAALFSGHKSAEARQHVRDFLRQNPDYPDNLRRKILEQSWLLMNGAQ